MDEARRSRMFARLVKYAGDIIPGRILYMVEDDYLDLPIIPAKPRVPRDPEGINYIPKHELHQIIDEIGGRP